MHVSVYTYMYIYSEKDAPAVVCIGCAVVAFAAGAATALGEITRRCIPAGLQLASDAQAHTHTHAHEELVCPLLFDRSLSLSLSRSLAAYRSARLAPRLTGCLFLSLIPRRRRPSSCKWRERQACTRLGPSGIKINAADGPPR